ncbi:MAG: DNA-protecting protein DprA [Betaproteobacteria bacterium]|nr:DNA-protecting protein DprA [Betaproteobacteria bacterium]
MRHDPGLACWLQLSLTPGLGGTTLRGLLQEFGLPDKVIALGGAGLARFLPAAALDELFSEKVAHAVERALQWAAAPGHSVVTLADSAYPKLLLEIADPPALLYCVGRTELLNRPSLAVVGSRNATAQGVRDAERFARALSDAGLAIVSGLALGIDAAAHRGGIAGRSSTIAVFGNGIDILYPPRNESLAQEVGVHGLLVSEFPLGTPPARQNFPRRNRVISGLSQGVLIVEAALASGSLITARAGLEQGREVFAVPGSIHSPLAKGCHGLIKAGAKLVESADDILSELTAFRRTDPAGAPSGLVADPEGGGAPTPGSAVLAQMGFEPVDIDSLCNRAGLPADRVAAELLRLELDGRVALLPGGLYQRLH